MNAVFTVWLLFGLIGGGVTTWLVRKMWKSRRTATPAAKVLAAVVSTAAMLGAFGTLLGVIKAFGAVGGESIDPSQKARILAEGIAEAMNATAFGFVLWIPSVTAILVLTRTKTQPPPPG